MNSTDKMCMHKMGISIHGNFIALRKHFRKASQQVDRQEKPQRVDKSTLCEARRYWILLLQEFELLYYNLSSARIFFRAEEEEEEDDCKSTISSTRSFQK